MQEPEIAGPGFINLRFKETYLSDAICRMAKDSDNRLAIPKATYVTFLEACFISFFVCFAFSLCCILYDWVIVISPSKLLHFNLDFLHFFLRIDTCRIINLSRYFYVHCFASLAHCFPFSQYTNYISQNEATPKK